MNTKYHPKTASTISMNQKSTQKLRQRERARVFALNQTAWVSPTTPRPSWTRGTTNYSFPNKIQWHSVSLTTTRLDSTGNIRNFTYCEFHSQCQPSTKHGHTGRYRCSRQRRAKTIITATRAVNDAEKPKTARDQHRAQS